MEPDVRDEVVDYVRHWSERTGIAAQRLVGWMELARSKFYDWRDRYGRLDEHNAWMPRDHWLERWEKEAIVQFRLKHYSCMPITPSSAMKMTISLPRNTIVRIID